MLPTPLSSIYFGLHFIFYSISEFVTKIAKMKNKKSIALRREKEVEKGYRLKHPLKA